MTLKEIRKVYLAFEFDKDAHRRLQFLSQANLHCHFRLNDLSLPTAVHDSKWQHVAVSRILQSDIVLILLGPDTHNAPGVRDEISLAGQSNRPMFQLMPQKRVYGIVSKHIPSIRFKWLTLNVILTNPREALMRFRDHPH
jgi:hypothetical protein